MLTTKRYDYVPFDQIHIHPSISNHRGINERKVTHYAADILKNGLLEPLIVWERKGGEYFLVGGFHRLQAIKAIREKNPGYFDRIDVRVVDGELDEMQALNLKLNADRLDARVTDYFDAVIFMNNANWSTERIAEFLDKSVTWIEEIIRFVPGMDIRLRKMLEEGKISWNRAKTICTMVLDAEPGTEKQVLNEALTPSNDAFASPRPLTFRKVTRTLTQQIEERPKAKFTFNSEELLSLLLLVRGKGYNENHVERVRKVFRRSSIEE